MQYIAILELCFLLCVYFLFRDTCSSSNRVCLQLSTGFSTINAQQIGMETHKTELKQVVCEKNWNFIRFSVFFSYKVVCCNRTENEKLKAAARNCHIKIDFIFTWKKTHNLIFFSYKKSKTKAGISATANHWLVIYDYGIFSTFSNKTKNFNIYFLLRSVAAAIKQQRKYKIIVNASSIKTPTKLWARREKKFFES